MGTGVLRGYPRPPRCSQFAAGVHPLAGSGPPSSLGLAPHLIKSRLASPPSITRRAFCRMPGEDLSSRGVRSGALSPCGDPGAASPPVPPFGSWGEQPSPSGVCGFPSSPALSQATFGHVPGRPHAGVVPPLQLPVGTVILGKSDIRRGRARAAVLPSALAPLLCGWESRALLLWVALGFFSPVLCYGAELPGPASVQQGQSTNAVGTKHHAMVLKH